MATDFNQFLIDNPNPQQRQGSVTDDNGLLSLIPFFDTADQLFSGEKVSLGNLGLDVASVLPFGSIARLGKVAKQGSRGVKAAGSVGKGSRTLNKADDLGRLSKFGQNQRIASTGVEDAISSSQAGKTLFTRDRVEQAGETALRRFKGKSPKAIERELPKVRDLILEERTALLQGTVGSITEKNLTKRIGSKLADFGLTPGDRRKIQEIVKRNVKLGKKNLSAEDLQRISSDLNKNVKATVFDIGGSTANRVDDIALAIREGVDESLESLVKGPRKTSLKNLNKEISDLFIINKGSVAGSRSAAGSVRGAPIPKNLVRRAQRTIGDKTLGLTGELSERSLRRPVAMGAIQGIGDSFTGTPSAPLPSTPPTSSGSQLASALTETQQQTPSNFLSQDQILGAIQQDLALNGGENLALLKSLLDISESLAPAEADKGVQQSLSTINVLENLFNEAGGGGGRIGGLVGKTQGALGLNDSVNIFEDERVAAATSIARAFGETRPTDEDIRRILRAIPSVSSTPGEASGKFQALKQLLGKGTFSGSVQSLDDFFAEAGV